MESEVKSTFGETGRNINSAYNMVCSLRANDKLKQTKTEVRSLDEIQKKEDK